MIFFALAAALAAPMPAAPSHKQLVEVRRIQAKYGLCVVKKSYEAARQFVLSPDVEGSVRRRLGESVGDGSCLLAAADSYGGLVMRFPNDTMRYALADALVRNDYAISPSTSLKDAPVIAQPELDESKFLPTPGHEGNRKELDRLAESRTERAAVVYLAMLGECVVRQNTTSSYSLLMADPDTDAETSAFVRLKPTVADCLVAGQMVALNKAVLRGTIAMNYYRLAQTSRPSTASAR